MTDTDDLLAPIIAVVRSRALSIGDAWAVLAAARPAIEQGARAAAWDEGFDAGHQAARAVNPEWPEQPTNPYRTALATGTTNQQEGK